MADKIPTFEWNSEESGKKDSHVFEAALQSQLATRQCRFVLDNNAIAINTPINASFDTAIGILQSMLITTSRMDT
jgi:hypothetical protein